MRALVTALGIGDRFHLLGQSWGGMLGPEFVLADPHGVQSLTICDSPASMPLWLEAAGILRSRLPANVQEVLSRHEEAGTTDSPEYLAAMQVFYDRHVCRVTPNPPEVLDSFAQLDAGPDRLPHDERPERVPRRRVPQGLERRGPGRRHRRTDARRRRFPR